MNLRSLKHFLLYCLPRIPFLSRPADLADVPFSDAFPKVAGTYKQRSARGGFATLFLVLVIALLVWHELQQFLYGEALYTFSVDRGIGHHLQINVDMTVAMPCHCVLQT